MVLTRTFDSMHIMVCHVAFLPDPRDLKITPVPVFHVPGVPDQGKILVTVSINFVILFLG